MREKTQNPGKFMERSGNLCSQRNLIVAVRQNNFSEYFVHTTIHFSYMMSTKNLDQ